MDVSLSSNQRLRVSMSCQRLCVAVLVSLFVTSVTTSHQTPTQELTLLSRDGTQTLPVTTINERQMVPLADLATLFNLTVREDTLVHGVTITYQDKVVVLTSTQSLTSIEGRIISLPTPPVQNENVWFVPVEFINQVLSLLLDMPLQVRADSRLVIVGDIHVPHIEVGYTQMDGQAQVSFEMSPPTLHTVVQEADRLIVKFEADLLDLALPESVSDSLIVGISRTEQPNWIAVNLGADFASYQSSLIGIGASTQLVVNILSQTAAARSVAGASDRRSEAQPSSSDTRTDLSPDLDLSPAPELRTIVIDAGHGGNDTGTQGQAGLQEKDITLQVARRLREAIESRLGLRVVMTRDSDRTVRLDERAAIANNNKADLFISLHINSSVSEAASGAVVYSLSLNDYGEATLSENRQSHTVPLLGGRTRNIEIVLWDLAQVTHVQDSALFAGFVDVELRRRINMNALTLQQAPFRVLVGANMPAVLVEMGFISNALQEEQLASLAFQDRVVQGLLQSVVTYRESLRDRWQAESSQRSNRPPAEEEP